MSTNDDINEVPEGMFPINFNIINQYQRKYQNCAADL